jgi:hypothetical protein
MLAGIERGSVTLPDIGVFVFPDQIALDYRMGDEWGPAQLRAFFRLLYDVGQFDTQSSVGLRARASRDQRTVRPLLESLHCRAGYLEPSLSGGQVRLPPENLVADRGRPAPSRRL